MIPNTSVSPAASRKSRTPYCNPLSNCASSRFTLIASLLLQWALLVVRILVIAQGKRQRPHADAAFCILRDLENGYVLDREVVVVEPKRSSYRSEEHTSELQSL